MGMPRAKDTHRSALLGSAFFVLVLGCRPAPKADACLATSPAPAPGPVAATFGSQSLSTAALQQRLAAMPSPDRQRFASPQQKKAWIEELVQTELLAKEALELGLQSDPA